MVDGRYSAHYIEPFYFVTQLLSHNVCVAGLIPPMDDRCGGVAAAVTIDSGVPLQRGDRRLQPSSAVPNDGMSIL